MNLETSYLIHVDSKFKKASENIYNFTFDVPPNKDGFKRAKMALYSLEFPAGTISQINNTNNKIDITEGVTNATITIPEGNYTIIELLPILKSLFEASTVSGNTYSFTYSEITNKLSLRRLTGTDTLTILSSSVMAPLLGITSNIIVNATATDFVFQDEVNLTPIRYIYLTSSNIVSSTYAGYIGGNQILFKIPLSVNRNSLIFYSNSDIKNDVVHVPILPLRWQFSIIDEQGNYINTNGINYSFSLRLYPY